ncbi:hypothetical protein Z948_1746 [Sulfitobacter donghicola DSW-25 = KCTC 12864 = JCM 14565]|nr:hypothetical protein Z948_1746 [Sulfitobacter donghicola DSW-25 = KCTC 12864 = JCM 14565]
MTAGIDDNKVVSKAMHLHEGQRGGGFLVHSGHITPAYRIFQQSNENSCVMGVDPNGAGF